MAESRNNTPSQLNLFLDFLTLGLTFFLSCLILAVDMGFDLLLQAFVYSTILVFFVRLAAQFVDRYADPVNPVIGQIVSNAVGILVGTFTMIVIQSQISSDGDTFAVIVFSGFMAFFILGTLSSIVGKKTPTTH